MTLAVSPFVPPPARPPAPRHRDPLDAVAPVSALAELVTMGSPRWAYSTILASLIGSQRGLTRLRPELLAGHHVDSDRVLADLVSALDRKAGQVPDPEPLDAPTALISDQRLVHGVAAWSRSTVLSGVCRPVTRTADPQEDPRLFAITELLASGGTAAADADLLAVTGAICGPYGIDITPRDQTLPRHVVLAARHNLYAADVTGTAAELLEWAGSIDLDSIERGRPRPPMRPPVLWCCGGPPHECPISPPPQFARRSMLQAHRGNRHRHPRDLGYVLDPLGIWQVDDAEPSPREIGRAQVAGRLG